MRERGLRDELPRVVVRPLGHDLLHGGEGAEAFEHALAKVSILFDGPAQLARAGPVHQASAVEPPQVAQGERHVVTLEAPERVRRGFEQRGQQVVRDGRVGIAGRLGHTELRDAGRQLRTVH